MFNLFKPKDDDTIKDSPISIQEAIMTGLAYKDFRLSVRGENVQINYGSDSYLFLVPDGFPDRILKAIEPQQPSLPQQPPLDEAAQDG